MGVYQETVTQHSLGRKFGECYCRDSVIHGSGTKSALVCEHAGQSASKVYGPYQVETGFGGGMGGNMNKTYS